jgi:organic hydroperoxide reductase OsmC/OhrA
VRSLVLAIVASVALAPTANATPQDDQYLAALASRNVGGTPDQLIAYGHAACDGYGTPGVADQAQSLESIGYTDIQAADIVATAVLAYCPEKLPTP